MVMTAHRPAITGTSVVPRRGLEPPRLAALVPETSASTNSATWAGARTDKGPAFTLSTFAAAERLAGNQLRATAGAASVQAGSDPVSAAHPKRKERAMTATPLDTLVTVFG